MSVPRKDFETCKIDMLKNFLIYTIYTDVDSINLSGLLGQIDWDELFSVPRVYWLDDVRETLKYLDDQLGDDLPAAIRTELAALESRIKLDI